MSFDAVKVTNKLHMAKFFTNFFQKKSPEAFRPRGRQPPYPVAKLSKCGHNILCLQLNLYGFAAMRASHGGVVAHLITEEVAHLAPDDFRNRLQSRNSRVTINTLRNGTCANWFRKQTCDLF